MVEVSDIYDNLFDFESRRNTDVYPIHKRLKLGREFPDLMDWVMAKVNFSHAEKVLDVGCGTGYSLIKLAKEKKIKGLGISISKNEIEFARKRIKDKDVEKQISFSQCSFDAPISEKFDKILALESLKHSSNLEITLKNLCDSLLTNGFLVIADDFSTINNSKLLDYHVKLWNAKSYSTKEHLINTLDKIRDFKIASYDLTDKVPVRNKIALFVLSTITRTLIVFCCGKIKIKMKTYLGGLILEKLYSKGLVNYNVFILS